MTEEKSYEPVLDALKVLKRLFRASTKGKRYEYHEYADKITDLLIHALNRDYSKIVSESLVVVGAYLNTLLDANLTSVDQKFAQYTPKYYSAVVNLLKKVDIDQEVKTGSIIAAAILISVCHSCLKPDQMEQLIQVFPERLNN